jgi:hypothetical protein
MLDWKTCEILIPYAHGWNCTHKQRISRKDPVCVGRSRAENYNTVMYIKIALFKIQM